MKKGIVKLILPVVVTTGAVTGAVITTKVMSNKSFFNGISNQKTLNYVEKENSEEAIADVNTALTEAEKLVNDANEKVEAAKEEEKKVEAVKEEAEKEITDAEETIKNAEATVTEAKKALESAESEDEKASLNAKIKEAEEQAQQALKAKEEAEAKAKKAEEDAKIAEQKRKDAEAEQAKKAAEAERIRKEAEEAEKTRKEAEEAAKKAAETQVESEPLTSSNKTANNTTTANNATETKKEEEEQQGNKYDLNNYPEILEQINEETKKQEEKLKEEAAKKKVEFHFYSTNKNLTIHCREDFCGDSGHIWFVELECDSDKCEGFTDSNGKQVSTMLVGRRADITEITVTAPAAKPGYKFVGWELISSKRLVENGLGDKGYLTGKYIATYEKI